MGHKEKCVSQFSPPLVINNHVCNLELFLLCPFCWCTSLTLCFALAGSHAATAPAIGMGGWVGVTRSGWQLSNPAIYLHVRIHASTPSVIGLNLIPFSQTTITQSHWSEDLWSLCFVVEPPRPARQSHGRVMAKPEKSFSVRDKC